MLDRDRAMSGARGLLAAAALSPGCGWLDSAPPPEPVTRTIRAAQPEAEPATRPSPGRGGGRRPAPSFSEPALQIPASGGRVTQPDLPVLARLPDDATALAVSLWLDGRDVTDPLGVLATRSPNLGGGVDYLATLDLIDLAPGPHELELRAGPHTLTAPFTYAPAPIRLDLELLDGEGELVPAKVIVLHGDGSRADLAPPGAAALPHGGDSELSTVFCPDGRGALFVEPGTWQLVATRGPRAHIDAQTLTVDASRDVTFSLPTAVPTPGELSADLHVHSGRSGDSLTPDRLRMAALVTSGLDAAVITDHDEIGAMDAARRAVAPASALHTVAGAEVSLEGAVGHANPFPLAGSGAPVPRRGLTGLPAVWDALRSRHAEQPPASGAALVLQLNHPRGIRPGQARGGYWAETFDPTTPPGDGTNAWMTTAAASGTRPLDFDALEVVNRASVPLYIETRADWFALMNAGWFLTGTGNSDSHRLEVELVGQLHNLVRVDGAWSERAFADAIRAGRVRVSNGPLVSLEVRSAGATAGPGELLRGQDLEVLVTVDAAPWVPIAEVRLVVDGEVVEREPLDVPSVADGPPHHSARTWSVHLDRDGWIAAEVGFPVGQVYRGGGPYAVVAPNYTPLGFTNAVRIDADGDGEVGRTGGR